MGIFRTQSTRETFQDSSPTKGSIMLTYRYTSDAIQALVKRHRNWIRSLTLKSIREKSQNHFSQSLPYMNDSRFFQDKEVKLKD